MAVPERARKRARELTAELEHHNHRYYVLDDPAVSDADYDQLFRELQTLENEFPELCTSESPTQRVGGAPAEQFESVRHRLPMLSLGNVFDADEFRAFYQRLSEQLGQPELEFVVEPTLDGLAINLT